MIIPCVFMLPFPSFACPSPILDLILETFQHTQYSHHNLSSSGRTGKHLPWMRVNGDCMSQGYCQEILS